MVGRGVDCDLIVDDATASRQHALIRWSKGGAELVCLGKNPTLLNGAVVTGTHRLQDGDRVQLPGSHFRVRIQPAGAAGALWALHAASAGTRPISADGPFTVGGAPSDHLHLPDQLPGVLVLHVEDGAPYCQAARDLVLNGTALPAGQRQLLAPDDAIEMGPWVLRVRQLIDVTPDETRTLPSVDLPTEVQLAFVHRGGELTVALGATQRRLKLTERRADFIAVLLRPPRGYQPGHYIPDAVLFPRVWGPQGGSRNSVNVLINRVRRDLNDAGLPGPTLIERFAGGTATRFQLHPNARVAVG